MIEKSDKSYNLTWYQRFVENLFPVKLHILEMHGDRQNLVNFISVFFSNTSIVFLKYSPLKDIPFIHLFCFLLLFCFCYVLIFLTSSVSTSTRRHVASKWRWDDVIYLLDLITYVECGWSLVLNNSVNETLHLCSLPYFCIGLKKTVFRVLFKCDFPQEKGISKDVNVKYQVHLAPDIWR